MKRVLLTGSNGFIGKNMYYHLQARGYEVVRTQRGESSEVLKEKIRKAGAIVHLAGVNRSKNEKDFIESNIDYTKEILAYSAECQAKDGVKRDVVFSSSVHAERDDIYGRTKRQGERLVKEYEKTTGSKGYIVRLPGIYGKWGRPYYNSVVATFCHSISHGEHVEIIEETRELELCYVDKVCEHLCRLLDKQDEQNKSVDVDYSTTISLGELRRVIEEIRQSEEKGVISLDGDRLLPGIVATYSYYRGCEQEAKRLISHSDERGSFMEVFKGKEIGQVSYLRINRNEKRGGHFHHSKREVFVVVEGKVKIMMQNVSTGKEVTIEASADEPRLIETVPGYAHTLVNDSDSEAAVMIWANEVYDQAKPDTIGYVNSIEM